MYKRRKTFWLYFSIFILLIGLAIFWPIKSDITGARLDAKDAKLVAQGEKIYVMHCASCHGASWRVSPTGAARNQKGAFWHRLTTIAVTLGITLILS